MGLRAFFGMDPAADLGKAEKLLEREPVRALELAERAARADQPDLRARAAELAGRARARIVAGILERVDEAEGKGELDTAASWLESALGHERDDGRRAALEARRAALLERLDEERSPFGARRGLLDDDALDDGDLGPEVAADGAAEADVDARFETLVAMLAPAVAPRYAERPAAFREAVVALNEGDAAAALPLLDGLLAASPDDPVLRLERGHARLLLGDAAGARGDLAAARGAFGDEPLDAADALSLPLLEAEAALAAGDAQAAADRLAPLADPAGERTELCHAYAAALVELGGEEAVAYAERAAALRPRDPRFRLHLAHALARGGDLDAAIATLEPATAPDPEGGRRRGRAARHLPSLRALAELHLRREGGADRAAELLAMVANEQDGLLAADDHATLARYYRQTGDAESASWCEAEAERLRSAGADALSAPPGLPAAGGRRVL